MASRSSTSSPTDPPHRTLPDTVTVAVVRRPHGVRGEVAVTVLTDVPERLAPGSEVTAVAAGGGRRLLRVARSRPYKGGLLVAFEGMEDRDGAAALSGAELEIPRSAVPPAPAGTYYHFELVGCLCRDRERGELGEVVEVVEDGGGLILLVRGGQGEVPVPFVERFLRSVDVERGVIEVDLPRGLVEACGSR